MKSILSLTKRNIKIYLNSRTNIIFSLLSVLILVSVYFLFLRDMNMGNFERIFRPLGESPAKKQLLLLSDTLMLACVVSVGAVTVSLTALGIIVGDRDKKIVMDFTVAPIPRYALVTSYFLSSYIICLAVTTLFIFLGGFMLLILYGVFFGFIQLLYIYAASLLALVFGNALMIFIISFLRKENALGGLGAVVGTLIGFVSGAYVPVSVFAENLQDVILCLPFAQITAVLKKAFMHGMDKHVNVSAEGYKAFLENNGVNILVGGNEIAAGWLALIIAGYCALFAFLSWLRFRKKQK